MSLFLYGLWFLDILKKFRSHEDIFMLTSKSFKAFFFEFCYLFIHLEFIFVIWCRNQIGGHQNLQK